MRPAKPIRLPGQASEPEPDRCVVRGRLGITWAAIPARATSPWSSRSPTPAWPTTAKLATKVYGPAGIPVYWIVNLVDRQVEVYTGPGPGGYASRAVFTPGQAVPVVIGGQQLGAIAVDDILP